MDYTTLEIRLQREKLARVEAEKLLEQKSQELYDSSRALTIASNALKDQSTQLNAILESANVGIMLVGADGCIYRSNRAAEELFGFKPETLTGHEALPLLFVNDHSLSEVADLLPIHHHKILREDFCGVREDGAHFPMELAVTKVTLNAVTYFVWICRDITERKEAELKRAELERELSQSQKMEALGTLSAGIAHEINTPVQYVTDNVHFFRECAEDLSMLIEQYHQGMDEAINGKNISALWDEIKKLEKKIDLDYLLSEVPQAIEQAQDGLIQIAKIVAAIKSFAHPGAEKKTLINVNEAIQTTATVARNQWKYVAGLETDFDADLPLTPCLPGEFNQVMLNLIINAAQAIEERGADHFGQIKIQTRHENCQVEIYVNDNGCGIKPENYEKIFDPFFTTKKVGKGTGQGLSLCYNIVVNKHGGSLTFTSEVGKGTTFIIKLPLFDENTSLEDVA